MTSADADKVLFFVMDKLSQIERGAQICSVIMVLYVVKDLWGWVRGRRRRRLARRAVVHRSTEPIDVIHDD